MLRRPTVLLAVLALFGGLAMGTTHSASAAVQSPAASPHTAANFSGGWEEAFDTNGNLVHSWKFSVAQTPSGDSTAITFKVSMGGQTMQYFFRAPNGQSFTVGQDYSVSPNYSSDAYAIMPSITNPVSGSLHIDRLAFNGDGSIASVGIEYDILDAQTECVGEIAWNLPAQAGQGYYLYDNSGNVGGLGNDDYLTYFGDLELANLNAPIVSMATTPDGGGYWMLGADGGVFSYGDAGFYGSTGNLPLNAPIVGMATTSDGKGYWFVASDGGMFAYGDARFYGSMGGRPLNEPIIGMAAKPDGKGYWLVASDGGIFSFGDAKFYGSTGNLHLNKPIVGMTASPDGKGYWFVASDGGIFSFGDAKFHGSTGNLTLNSPIEGMESTADGNGYWLVAYDGGVFNYGDASFSGSLGGRGITGIVGIARS